MKCPYCSTEMITGDIICRHNSAPGLYPHTEGETEFKRFKRQLFGKGAIIRTELEEGHYCPQCDKIIVVWKKGENDK